MISIDIDIIYTTRLFRYKYIYKHKINQAKTTPATAVAAPAIAPLVKNPFIPNEVKVANKLPALTAPIEL